MPHRPVITLTTDFGINDHFVGATILALVGIVSGFFPALKAARMHPIEALRYE